MLLFEKKYVTLQLIMKECCIALNFYDLMRENVRIYG